MIEFKTAAKKLYPYAYNILGNRTDCEDVIQEVIMNFAEKNTDSIVHQDAYLIKAVINRSINLKKKNDKEQRKKVTLPEPIVTNYAETRIEMEEILNYSMLVLLDTLNTKERAVFLLKEIFDYEHEEVASLLSVSIENSRQLLTRAKKKLKLRKPIVAAPQAKDIKHLEQYIQAIRLRDITTLEQMLSQEVQVFADGGSKMTVVAELTSGIEDTIKLVTYLFEHYQKEFQIKIEEINHQPALLFYQNTTLINCQIFEFNENGEIVNIFSVVDPDKLIHI